MLHLLVPQLVKVDRWFFLGCFSQAAGKSKARVGVVWRVVSRAANLSSFR